MCDVLSRLVICMMYIRIIIFKKVNKKNRIDLDYLADRLFHIICGKANCNNLQIFQNVFFFLYFIFAR